MAPKISTGLRNFLQMDGSIKRFVNGAILLIYSGAQPTTADDAPNGSLLNTITVSSGAHTAETLSTGTVTLTGGASGNVSSITVDGIEILGATVTYNSSLTQTATDIATQINTFMSSPEYSATASGEVVTISAQPGTGAGPNTFVVAVTSATITTSKTDFAGGVASVNGLTWGLASAGVLSKSGVWSGVAAADGTPGWFRIVRALADASGSSAVFKRLDGTISTSSADLNISPNVSNNGITLTIDTFTITEPAA